MKVVGMSYYALIKKNDHYCKDFKKLTPYAIIYGKIVRIVIDENSTIYDFEFYSDEHRKHIISISESELFKSREEAKKHLIDNIDELVIENI